MEFTFQPLDAERLDEAAELCGACVGENLYPRSLLAAILGDPERQFWLLSAPGGEIAGYIYFFLSDLPAMARLSKLPQSRLAAVSPKRDPVIGNLQSIGVAEPWRGRGLSRTLVDFYLDRLFAMGADLAFGVFWKPRGRFPMGRTLAACGFRSLGEAQRVWYDLDDLVCPYCQGRCVCPAEVCYKALGNL